VYVQYFWLKFHHRCGHTRCTYAIRIDYRPNLTLFGGGGGDQINSCKRFTLRSLSDITGIWGGVVVDLFAKIKPNLVTYVSFRTTQHPKIKRKVRHWTNSQPNCRTVKVQALTNYKVCLPEALSMQYDPLSALPGLKLLNYARGVSFTCDCCFQGCAMTLSEQFCTVIMVRWTVRTVRASEMTVSTGQTVKGTVHRNYCVNPPSSAFWLWKVETRISTHKCYSFSFPFPYYTNRLFYK